jgi:DUF1365 family protein
VTRASALYTGSVTHLRRGSPAHSFRYRLYMLYLDLDELPALLAGPGPLRAGRFGLLSWERADYLRGAPDLAEEARERVRRALGFRPEGPVRILAHPRSLGHAFNPVTFSWCFDRTGQVPQAVVAEITNTPWNERHAYVLPAGPDGAVGAFAKTFHVSPFLPMEQGYRWRLGAPGASLAVEMASDQDGREAFRARLDLRRVPWSAGALWRAALAMPLMSWKVQAGIYAQALSLWARGAPFHVHPRKRAAPAAGEAPRRSP